MKKLLILTIVVAAAVICHSAWSAEAEKTTTQSTKPTTATTQPASASGLTTETDRISYAIGVQIGTGFKRDGLDINPTVLAGAIADVLADKPLAMTKQQIKEVVMNLRQKISVKMQAERSTMGSKNLAEGKAFLEKNAKEEGVKVLPSGLQYKVIKEGTGKTPKATDKVKTHYRGTLINGEEFDSSYKRGKPAEFPVKGVIAGWTEALQLMKEGAKWKLFIPSDLAYGKSGSGRNIPPNTTLIFEIELIEIVK